MMCTGRALAQVLEGCWRPEPPALEPLELSAAGLEALSPLLAGSGAAGLAWRRLRRSALGEHPGALELRAAAISQALGAQVQEREIERILLLLESRGIPALLVKGWEAARLYPEPGLRPFGDVDLLVRPEDGPVASEALGVPADSAEGQMVDLKTRLPGMYGRTVGGLLGASRLVPLRQSWARVLGAEDQVRLLCLHFLRHGAWRPLWLCDIAAALEARPQGFSWERCLGSEPGRADRVACALGLAHQLLGADVAGTPVEERARRLPRWLAPEVLRQWATPTLGEHQARPLLASTPRGFGPVMRALMLRWPNPIEASVVAGAPIAMHPLPAQALVYAGICGRFLLAQARPGRPKPGRSAP